MYFFDFEKKNKKFKESNKLYLNVSKGYGTFIFLSKLSTSNSLIAMHLHTRNPL